MLEQTCCKLVSLFPVIIATWFQYCCVSMSKQTTNKQTNNNKHSKLVSILWMFSVSDWELYINSFSYFFIKFQSFCCQRAILYYDTQWSSVYPQPIKVSSALGVIYYFILIFEPPFSQNIFLFHGNRRSQLYPFSSVPNKGRFCNNSKICTLISKRLFVENKVKLSQLETQNTFSTVLFIYNFQLREFRFVLYR